MPGGVFQQTVTLASRAVLLIDKFAVRRPVFTVSHETQRIFSAATRFSPPNRKIFFASVSSVSIRKRIIYMFTTRKKRHAFFTGDSSAITSFPFAGPPRMVGESIRRQLFSGTCGRTFPRAIGTALTRIIIERGKRNAGRTFVRPALREMILGNRSKGVILFRRVYGLPLRQDSWGFLQCTQYIRRFRFEATLR